MVVIRRRLKRSIRDNNTTTTMFTFIFCLGMLASLSVTATQGWAAERFEQFFPYGAYVIGYNPDGTVTNVKDRSAVAASFDRTCGDLAAHNMNCVWANNLAWDMLPLWLEAGRDHGIRIIAQGGGPGFLRPEKFKNKDALLEHAEPLYQDLAGRHRSDDALLAWSVTEEAGRSDWFYQGLAELTAQMAQWDPCHPMISLDNRATSAWMNATVVQPKALCNDVYVFFADGINGPYRAMGSRDLFRRNCRLFRAAARQAGSRFWMMGQGMSEEVFIDGVKSHCIYRYPTGPEMRWQVWAAIQEGAKGIFFYIYQNRAVYANGVVDHGLRDHDGCETQQFRMLAEVGGQMTFLMPLLLKLDLAQPHEAAIYWDNGPVSGRTHIDRATGRRFIIAVNNDFREIQPINIELGYWPKYLKPTEKVFDLRTRRAYDYQSFKVTTLQPGDGTVLLVGTDEDWQQFSREFFTDP